MRWGGRDTTTRRSSRCGRPTPTGSSTPFRLRFKEGGIPTGKVVDRHRSVAGDSGEAETVLVGSPRNTVHYISLALFFPTRCFVSRIYIDGAIRFVLVDAEYLHRSVIAAGSQQRPNLGLAPGNSPHGTRVSALHPPQQRVLCDFARQIRTPVLNTVNANDIVGRAGGQQLSVVIELRVMLYVTNHILVPTIMPPCCVSIVIVSLLMSEERDDSMIGSYPLYRICGSLKCLLLHSNP